MRFFVFSIGLLGVACSDAVQPAPLTVPGRYVLEGVNAGGVPAVIAMVPPEVYRLTRGVVVLDSSGAFTDTTIIVIDAAPFGGLVADTTVTHGQWTQNDSTVTAGERIFTWRGSELERFVPRRLPLMDLTLRYVKH